jgi:hypothetical protein
MDERKSMGAGVGLAAAVIPGARKKSQSDKKDPFWGGRFLLAGLKFPCLVPLFNVGGRFGGGGQKGNTVIPALPALPALNLTRQVRGVRR